MSKRIMPTVLAGLALLLGRAAGADEDPPEVRAIASKLKDDLKSKTAGVRASAYKAMGELGDKGRSLRRTMCEGMLDKNDAVKTAAADALKQVDPDMAKLALGIYINRDIRAVAEAGDLGEKGEPLTPLVFALATSYSPMASAPGLTFEQREARRHLIICVNALVAIAPADLAVNKAVITMLSNPVPDLRAGAVGKVTLLKNRKAALPALLNLAASPAEPVPTRVTALTSVPDCVDENTREAARKRVEALRFDQQPLVRDAVDNVLKKLAKP